jgi:hypothetical protein
MGGIGKSALAAHLMYQQAEHFEVVIFRSLCSAPAFEALLDDCLQVLSPLPLETRSATLEQRLSLLLSHLRKTRTLLVLDNLECSLEADNPQGHFRPDFRGLGQLLRRVAETDHQSCLLITSREKPAVLRGLSGKHSPVRCLRLGGLDVVAGTQLLAEKDVVGTEANQECLIEAYSGNPLALKMAAEVISDLFGGEIVEFLASGTFVTGPVTDWLDTQFACLSRISQNVLCDLTRVREPVTLRELQDSRIIPGHVALVLEAINTLYRRGLIEPGKRSGSFTLSLVLREYITTVMGAMLPPNEATARDQEVMA